MAGMQQSVGEKVALKSGAPLSAERSAFKGGTVQSVGERVNLASSPTGQQFMNKNIKGGMVQSVGEKAPLSHTPSHPRGSEVSASTRADAAVKQK